MKKSVFVISFLASALTLSLVSCASSQPATPEHVHTFNENIWTYSEGYHWHPATCEHKEEKGDKAAHTFVKNKVVEPTTSTRGYTVYKCSVCGYFENRDYVDPVDPYKGRIKEYDMKVLDITDAPFTSNDPRYFDDAKNIKTYEKADTYKLYYLDQIDEVFYLPLSTFVDLYKGDFKDGVTNEVVENAGVATWTAKMGESEFKLTVDNNKKTIATFGDIEPSYRKLNAGKTGVNEQLKETISYIEGHKEGWKTSSFAAYDFDTFIMNNKVCYPLGLLTMELSKHIERKFLSVSEPHYLIEYVNVEQITDLSYLKDGDSTNYNLKDLVAGSYMNNYGVAADPKTPDLKVISMPKSLAEFNKKLIYCLLDNNYGLAKVKGIKSMSDYLENLNVSDLFTHDRGVDRGSAYSYAFNGFNDLHSGYGYSGFMGEGANSNSINPQSINNERTIMAMALNNLRKRALNRYNEANSTDLNINNVRYSKDGRYAYFSFDSFLTYNYFEQGEVPESEKLNDAYFLFVKNLNEIKAKGVKNVIIDDSLNGGGYVDIMGKILALMSKNNLATLYLKHDLDDSIMKADISVDSNGDGVYDTKDCFGNDMTFYIVTSNYSFSCGNAYPFYAVESGFAKTIGYKTGGGECCVYNYTLPTGQSITYSSPLHIGYYDEKEKTFNGDEYGVNAWMLINDNIDLYDVDTLQVAIDARVNPQA